MFEAPKTEESLIARLEESAKKPITKQQIERQRVSFVYGNLLNQGAITREKVEKRIKDNEGTE